MGSQQAKPGLPPDRPSFFGLPFSFYLWARVGPRFWGGLLSGLGLGLLVAAALAELGLQRNVWVGVIAILLAGIGQVIALRSVRRSLQLEKDQPQNP
jgi:predicted lipid-binding transport protein (Tim44 family)